MSRLPKNPMEKIDRDRRLRFTWQGRAMEGLAGDSVASAMHAHGVKIVGRSLKYHRPRGLYSLDGESANTMVTIDGECNVRAEQTLLKDGMAVTAQNYMGTVEKDYWGVLDKFDSFMPAGFYYHRGHKPAAAWPYAIKFIRKMAGTGVVNERKQYDNKDYTELFLNAEVCVVGGGPAGMTAALAAAEEGMRVVLFEGRPWLGGFYDWRGSESGFGTSFYERGRDLAGQVEAHENIRVFTHTFVTNICGDNLVACFQVGGPDDPFIQRYIQVRPTSVVVAAGCIERPLIFENNERPGVMQIGCAIRLARTYGVKPGQNAVFSVGHDLGLEAALDLSGEGVNVLAVVDARPEGQDAGLVQALKDRNITFHPGWAASVAHGQKSVTGVTLGALNGSGSRTINCDLLVASAGLTPVMGPLSTVGVKFGYDRHTGYFLPTSLPPRVHPAGRLLGYNDAGSIEASGRLAGLKAAADTRSKVNVQAAEKALEGLPGPAEGSRLVHGPNIGIGRKSFICFDEDGTFKTAKQSADQGFDVPELAKRFGSFGLGAGQYGIPGHNLPLVLSEMTTMSSDNAVPTTIRSPLVPTLMATLAGPNHNIYKQTAMQKEQEELGALFRRVGVWKRARYFSKDLSTVNEVEAVRNHVGIIDVSTLGKFRLHGPDAQKVLQRCYISNMSKIPEGKLKYSAMLNSDGMIIDDGVVAQLGENDYYLTTSTGRAGGTAEWFRYHARFEGWDFHIINLTDGLAAVNLAGPKSREILAKLTDADLSNEAFPFMGFREIVLNGVVPAKAMRVGFVGELSYELHYPASYGAVVWNWLMEAGQEYGIVPFGLEAQSLLRLEKGHVIIGQESEQRVNLLDLGMGFLWDRKDKTSKKMGAPALAFTENQEDRFKLVGLQMKDPTHVPGDGSIIYEGDSIMGFLCTCRHSRTLGQTIGLGLVKQSLTELGGTIKIYQNDRNSPLRYEATVVKTPFYDPEGKRLKS